MGLSEVTGGFGDKEGQYLIYIFKYGEQAIECQGGSKESSEEIWEKSKSELVVTWTKVRTVEKKQSDVE